MKSKMLKLYFKINVDLISKTETWTFFQPWSIHLGINVDYSWYDLFKMKHLCFSVHMKKFFK